MYEQAYSSIHINGHTTCLIPMQCGVQQGCPLSMLLFALCLNPLLWLLDQTLTGTRIGRGTRTAVDAYADDTTLLVTDPKNIPTLAKTLRRYEKACLNIRKSKAVVARSWNTTVYTMDIPYCTEMTMLGFQFSNTVSQSGKEQLDEGNRTGRSDDEGIVRPGLKCLIQRIQYVHAFLLAEI